MDAAAESNVTISALDARGLYVSEIDASERGSSSALLTRLKSEYRRNSMSLNENVMAELAAGTGGTYFHNSNDLEGGFKRLAAGARVSVPVRVFDRKHETEWTLPSPEGESRSGRSERAITPRLLRPEASEEEEIELQGPQTKLFWRDRISNGVLKGSNCCCNTASCTIAISRICTGTLPALP